MKFTARRYKFVHKNQLEIVFVLFLVERCSARFKCIRTLKIYTKNIYIHVFTNLNQLIKQALHFSAETLKTNLIQWKPRWTVKPAQQARRLRSCDVFMFWSTCPMPEKCLSITLTSYILTTVRVLQIRLTFFITVLIFLHFNNKSCLWHYITFKYSPDSSLFSYLRVNIPENNWYPFECLFDTFTCEFEWIRFLIKRW